MDEKEDQGKEFHGQYFVCRSLAVGHKSGHRNNLQPSYVSVCQCSPTPNVEKTHDNFLIIVWALGARNQGLEDGK